MCFRKKKSGGAASEGLTAAQMVAGYDNAEATKQANFEALLRKRRSGTAANVLTSPVGVPARATRPVRDPSIKPATATLGGAAA